MNENKRKYIPPLISFIVAFAFALPILLDWKYIGPRDWELFTTMAAVPVKTVLHYGQFPFWNPYIGGGNILFVHPEAAILSPFFLIYLIFGAIGGLKIQVMIAWFLGFWGSYRFTRRLGLSKPSSWLVSFSYFGSSYFALHFVAGHMPFTHFCFLPWLAYFVLKAEDNRKYILAGAFTVALIILGNGAAIPLLYTSFFVGMFALLSSIREKRFSYLKYFLISVLIGVLISSVKFIPMYLELRQFPWEGRADDFTAPSLLPSIFFSFNQFIFKEMGPGNNWPWHEYGAYLSPLVFALGIYGLIKMFRKLWIWMVLGLFFLIFGLGHFTDYSLWNLFMNLPGFASIRAPGRAFQFVVLSFAVMGGYGMDYIVRTQRERIHAIGKLVYIVPVLIIVINYGINFRSLTEVDYKKPAKVHFREDFRQELGGVEELYSQFQHNRGSLIAPWLSAYKPSRGIVMPDNTVAMEYILSGQAGVTSKKYTPNRVECDLNARTGGRIVFSIGYDKGWRAADSRRVYEQQGLVTVDFKQGRDHIELIYRTPHFYLYLAVSLIFLAASLAVFLNAKIGKWFKAVF